MWKERAPCHSLGSLGGYESGRKSKPKVGSSTVTITSYVQITHFQLSTSYPSSLRAQSLHHQWETPDISLISDMAGLGCVGTGRYPSSTHSCLHLPFLVRACLPKNPTTVVPPSHRRRASDHPHISMTTIALDSRYSMERK